MRVTPVHDPRLMTSMSEEPEPEEEPEPLPFIAPCRQIDTFASLRWLSQGFADLRKAPVQSITYGVFMATLFMLVIVLTWQYGAVWILFSMLFGFVFIAPLSCIGVYAISAQLERNQPVSMVRTLRAAFRRYIGNELVFALVLMVIFLVWARAASVVSVFLPEVSNPDFLELLAYIVVGAVVVVLFVGLTFAASVFALPMIMHRKVDTITAVLTSVNAVFRNKLAISVWIVLIVIGILIGIATFGIGLAIFLPGVGHAVWHGYLETIDASQFPRHEVGITSVARSPD
jgi:uncharacterized membrane protein